MATLLQKVKRIFLSMSMSMSVCKKLKNIIVGTNGKKIGGGDEQVTNRKEIER